MVGTPGARAGSGFILKGRIQILNKSFWTDNIVLIPPSLATRLGQAFWGKTAGKWRKEEKLQKREKDKRPTKERRALELWSENQLEKTAQINYHTACITQVNLCSHTGILRVFQPPHGLSMKTYTGSAKVTISIQGCNFLQS
jgi:hypothetical protein